jgi:hypothetical protein
VISAILYRYLSEGTAITLDQNIDGHKHKPSDIPFHIIKYTTKDKGADMLRLMCKGTIKESDKFQSAY